MKKSIFIVGILAFSTMIGSAFLSDKTTEEETSIQEEASVISLSDVKGAKSALTKVSEDDLAPISINTLAKEEIKIPTDLETKNIKNIKGEAKVMLAEKRPGGYLIETFYPTDTKNGDLVVAQSVNQYGVAHLLTDEVKNWYPDSVGGFKELELKGFHAILNENEEDANTLHIITDHQIYTIAGQRTEMLLEVADELIKTIQ